MPTRGTAKGRLLAQLKEAERVVTLLPEPACVLLEQSRVVETLWRHLGTFGHASAQVSGVLAPLADAVRSIARAVEAGGKINPRRRIR
jgi:hypothetical protein